jgi:hypothetical protein
MHNFHRLNLHILYFAVLLKKSSNRITFYCALVFKDSMYMNLTINYEPSALHRIVELLDLLAYDYEDDFENFKMYLRNILAPQNCRVYSLT